MKLESGYAKQKENLNYSTILKRLFILAAVIFLIDYVITVSLTSMGKFPAAVVGLVNSFILIVILSPVLYLLVIRSINQKIAEANYAKDENLILLSELDQIFNTAASAMRVIDSNFNVVRVNQAFMDMAGVTMEDCINKKCYETFSGPVCHTCNCTLVRVIESNGRIEYEANKRCTNGREIPCMIVATPFQRPDGKIIGIVEDFRDVTKQKKAEEEIRYQATHDPLTGLVNRMFFNEELSRCVMEMYRTRQKLCVMFLDMNNFKEVNDTYGHAVGDRLLMKVSKRIVSCVRKYDTVARLGGDEFTLILPQIYGKEDAVKIAGKITDEIKQPFYIDEHRINTSTSIGIAIYPDDGHDSKTLLINADLAMYRAKENGSRFELYQITDHNLQSTISITH